jgi:hypothetical protein
VTPFREVTDGELWDLLQDYRADEAQRPPPEDYDPARDPGPPSPPRRSKRRRHDGYGPLDFDPDDTTPF